jgi:hypothetical protein
MTKPHAKNDGATKRLLQAESAELAHHAALVEHCDGLAESSSRVMRKVEKDLDGIDNPELRERMGKMYLRAGNLRTMSNTLRGVLTSTGGRLGAGD